MFMLWIGKVGYAVMLDDPCIGTFCVKLPTDNQSFDLAQNGFTVELLNN
jgi:hypothetical protein